MAAAGPGGVEAACRELARERLWALFPEGTIEARPLETGGFSAPLTEEAVARTAALQGWVLRELGARQREELSRAARESAEVDRRVALMRDVNAPPGGSSGDWYECPVSAECPADGLRCALELAGRHPEDHRAQETALRALLAAARLRPKSGRGRAAGAGGGLAEEESAAVVLAALREHPRRSGTQRLACEAVAQLASGDGPPAPAAAAFARAANAAGALEEIAAAMLRTLPDAALQVAACAALLGLARHHQEGPLPEGLRRAVGAAVAAMAAHPRHAEVQALACALLWRVAQEEPQALSARAGLRGLLQHAEGAGVREAGWLLESVRWRPQGSAPLADGA